MLSFFFNKNIYAQIKNNSNNTLKGIRFYLIAKHVLTTVNVHRILKKKKLKEKPNIVLA